MNLSNWIKPGRNNSDYFNIQKIPCQGFEVKVSGNSTWWRGIDNLQRIKPIILLVRKGGHSTDQGIHGLIPTIPCCQSEGFRCIQSIRFPINGFPRIGYPRAIVTFHPIISPFAHSWFGKSLSQGQFSVSAGVDPISITFSNPPNHSTNPMIFPFSTPWHFPHPNMVWTQISHLAASSQLRGGVAKGYSGVFLPRKVEEMRRIHRPWLLFSSVNKVLLIGQIWVSINPYYSNDKQDPFWQGQTNQKVLTQKE